MNHISLFSGIGGFELAAEWAGWNNIASCEINPFGRKVLEYYWPNAYHHDDIHTLTKEILDEKTDWKSDELILTGGFPCQPYSVAGKRLGKEDERHLWPQMLRIIRELKPSWVVGENVFGLVNWNDGLVFDEVQADLEAEGYQVQAFVLPAASVNAPHRRDRVWFVAYADNTRRNTRLGEFPKADGEIPERHESAKPCDTGSGTVANTELHGQLTSKRGRSDGADSKRGKEGANGTKQSEGVCESGELGGVQTATNPNITRRKEWRQIGGWQDSTQNSTRLDDRVKRPCGNGNATNPNIKRQQKRDIAGQSGEQRQRLSATFSPPENWEVFPTQSPVCNGDDGLSSRLDGITFSKWRNESIKAGGNAIVPQVVYQIFKAIQMF